MILKRMVSIFLTALAGQSSQTWMGKIANRQSLAFSERRHLSQAILQFHVERMLNKWTPIARFESQHNERRVCEDSSLCGFGLRCDRQRTLAIRIAAITEKSDFDPHPQPQSSLLRIFRLQPGVVWKFLLRRTCSEQKLLPLQFPALSLPD